jgi:putative transposase
MEALPLVQAHSSLSAGCALLGLSRASVYRAGHRMHGPARPRGGGAQPNALSAAEVEAVLAVLHADRFADKAPEQVWAILLDEGTYLCSVATMYRILRSHNEVRERRNQATHPPRTVPELHATGPDQVWSWDITKLPGPVKGLWFCAYVIMDIYSRKVIHAEVHTREHHLLAADFIAAAVAANGGVPPGYVHSDNGSPMVAKPVTQLLSDLHITASLSRPHVSNDNPFSEAWNKTLKYAPVFPDRFGSITEARAFITGFVQYYNCVHRHSAIGLYTPASVHDGTWTTIAEHRRHVLTAAHTAHPNRFRRPPRTPTPPKEAWINRPTITTSDNHPGSAA